MLSLVGLIVIGAFTPALGPFGFAGGYGLASVISSLQGA
jgi:hypothetical protein